MKKPYHFNMLVNNSNSDLVSANTTEGWVKIEPMLMVLLLTINCNQQIVVHINEEIIYVVPY